MTTKLETRVKNICKEYAKDYESGMAGFIDDLRKGGCQSGMISELIYYTDTVKFYKRYANDIDVLLSSACDDAGCTPSGLFGKAWDNCDPLARDTQNQNLLAWFAFEETAFRLFDN